MRTLSPKLVRCLSAAFDNRTDSDLLNSFLTHHTETDFAELVRRHGPMVWGTCTRSLPDYADAEDAFQTVFLVLVQRGKRLLNSPSIGPWLHRVALWTARNVRRRNARRLARRATLPEHIAASSTDVSLSLDLDAALLSLPEKFRSPILLCHILGLSRAEAAAQLGCAERTLSLWLARGLAKLRQKLRGLDPTKALGIAAIAVPAGLCESVVRAAVSLQTAAIAASVLSPTISQLVEEVIRMFWVKKTTAASVALFAMFAFGVGVGVTTHQLSPAAGGEERIGVSQPVAHTDLPADLEIDARISQLEKKIAETKKAFDEAHDRTEKMLKQLKDLERVSLDQKVLEKLRDAVSQAQEGSAAFAKKLDDLKLELQKLRELKAKQALAKKLEKQEVEIDGNVNDFSLRELLTKLSKKHDVTFVIMEEAFKAEKITNIWDMKPRVADTKKLKGLKLGGFLDVVLKSIDATFIVRPDYIEITTFASKRLEEQLARLIDGVVIDDDDKNLSVLRKQLERSMALLEEAKGAAAIARLQAQKSEEDCKALQSETEKLHLAIQQLNARAKEKSPDAKTPATKPTGAYLQLTIGVKDAAWPYQMKEFGTDGKPIGTIAFENADVLGQYLMRTMKDAGGPKELKIVSRADSPYKLLVAALEACKSAGLKDIVIANEATDDKNSKDHSSDPAAIYADLIKRQLAADAMVLEGEKKQLQEEKAQQDAARHELERLLKMKDEEILKLKEENRKKKAGEGLDPAKP